jgi:predicted DNA-binding transcriptional regulator YafY
MYQQLEYFARWLLMLGNGATVLEPESLKDITRKQIKLLSEHYSC